MRAGSYLFSEAFNPWMRGVKLLADGLEGEPLPEEHPSMQNERQLIEQIAASIECARKLRDSTYEQVFDFLYGNLPRGHRAAQTQAGEERASESDVGRGFLRPDCVER